MINLIDVVRPYFPEEIERRGHGFDHALAVYRNGRHIALQENAEKYIVRAGYLLHDVGKAYEKEREICHSEIGAEMSKNPKRCKLS